MIIFKYIVIGLTYIGLGLGYILSIIKDAYILITIVFAAFFGVVIGAFLVYFSGIAMTEKV